MVTVDQYKVKVKVIFVDFSGGAEIYDKKSEWNYQDWRLEFSLTMLESVTQVISLMFQLTDCRN